MPLDTMTLVLAEDVARKAGVSDQEWRGFYAFSRANRAPAIDLPTLGVTALEYLTQSEAAALVLFARLLRSGVNEGDAACVAAVLAGPQSTSIAGPDVAEAFEAVAKIFGSADVVRLKVSVQVEGA